MRGFKPFIILIFLYFLPVVAATAQVPNDWPKLYPAYAEDFSDYNSFPSICFQKVFWDEQGKMWLIPCGGMRYSANIYLFQFDGYNFSIVDKGWEQISSGANFEGIYNKQWLAGSLGRPEVTGLFFYNINTGEIEIHDLKAYGYFKQYHINEKGQLFLFMEKEGYWVFYEWVDGKLVEEKKISIPKGYEFDYARNRIFLSEQKLLIKTKEDQTIFSVNKNTGLTKTIDISTFPLEGVPLDTLHRKEYGNTIIKVMKRFGFFFDQKGPKERLLYFLDPITETYERIENIPNEWWLYGMAKDELGNTVYVFKDEQGLFKSILIDQQGKYFDYSALFENLEGSQVDNLYSQDFKKELIICSNKGILLQRIKQDEAIKTILSEFGIRAIAELPDGQYIIGTQNQRSLLLNLEDKSYSTLALPNCDMNGKGTRTTFVNEEDRYIWTCFPERIVRYDFIENTCIEYKNQLESRIYNMVFTDKNQLILSHNSSDLSVYDLSTQTQKKIQLDTETGNLNRFIHDMIYDGSGFLWLATNKGFFRLDMQTYELTEISKQEGFLDNRFLCIDRDDNGKIWLGSSLRGLHIYDPSTEEVQILNSEDGLGNNTIAYIQKDDNGDRWLGTYNGVSIVSPNGKLIANLNVEDGIVNKEANRYAHLKMSNGNLLMGTIKGLNWINPRKVKSSFSEKKRLKIYLTALSYYDKNEGGDVQQLNNLHNLSIIKLPASNRNLEVKFALSNYFDPKTNQYAYKLESLNEDWVDIGNQHSLNLLNLPAGKYNLLIKGRNKLGNWTETPVVIPIYAKAYLYEQSWFILLAVFGSMALLAGIAWMWIKQLRRQVKLATHEIRKDKKVIEEQAEQLLELDKAKSHFFTNISHEFRTPLTVILGMIDKIINEPEKWGKNGGGLVKRNAKNLLNLVNQILDLRKLESGKLKLDLYQADVIPHLKEIYESFDSLGANKSVRLFLHCEEETIVMDHDPEKLLRIVSNLLSNAIKFTPENGKVYLNIKKTAIKSRDIDQLIIQVKDTGIGMPPEKLSRVFDQFYQLENTAKWAGHGTGIGLALSKELVELMGGSIQVESEVGQGSTFAIALPIIRTAPLKEESSSNLLDIDGMYSVDALSKKQALTAATKYDNDLPLILLIDDSQNILQYLIACLEGLYRLAIANDGQEGIEKALEIIPDVIISDVMMPKKNGYEVCDELKNNEKTSHIPIVLLTAKASIHSKIEGLQKGADAYLTKPFEEKELLIRLRNFIESRQRLQEFYQENNKLSANEVEHIDIQQEDEFLQKIRTLLIDNIDDSVYGIDQICRDIGMSRSQMHRKMKALTGESTSIFLRRIRMHKSKALLEETNMSVSEVCYAVGITNPSYFARMFLKEFGYSPSEARK